MNVVEGGEEQMDQIQTSYDNTFYLYRGIWRAQSFTPTLLNLNYIDVFVGKIGSPTDDLVLSVRSDLTGSDLAVVSIPYGSIPQMLDWVRFDFSDLGVVPGEVYYIILKSAGGNSLNCYVWGYDNSNPYDFGSFWYSSNYGSNWFEFVL